MRHLKQLCLSLLLVMLITGLVVPPSHAATYYCGKDSDGDGKVTSEGEVEECVGNTGLLCPIGAVDCTDTLTEPACSGNGAYNVSTDRCETTLASTTSYVCSLTGTTYTSPEACSASCSSSATCTPSTSFPVCPAGGAYNNSTNQCEVTATGVTSYYCSSTGGYYGSASECYSACYYTTGCNPVYPTASGTITAPEGYYLSSAIPATSGNTLPIYSSGYRQLGNITLTNANALRTVNTSDGVLVGAAVTSNGVGLTTYYLASYDTGWGNYETYAASQELYFYGVTMTGGFVGTTPVTTIVGSGNSLIFYNGSTVLGSISFTSVAGYTCPYGSQYGCSGGVCSMPGTCTATTTGYTCPSGYTLSGTTCVASASCPTGSTFNASDDLCYDSTTMNCPLGSQYSCSGGTCSAAGSCTANTAISCPAGYESDGSLCYGSAVCPTSATLDTTADQCRDSTTQACPLGNYACHQNGSVQQCSALACFDPKTPGTDASEVVTKVDNTMYVDDGETDENGNCLGTVYLFTGRGQRCRLSGIDTGWQTCCSAGDSVIADSIGSAFDVIKAGKGIATIYEIAQVAYYTNLALTTSGTIIEASSAVTSAVSAGMAAGSVSSALTSYALAAFTNPVGIALSAAMYLVENFLLSGSCDQEDLETAMACSSGRCHQLGTYCEKEWPLIGCVQESESYCCFNSKLARIIHEQGRPQLTTFVPLWSYPTDEEPTGNCRGFTTAEFQMLDFSNMDLSEYFTEITTKAQSTIQETVNDKINTYYNNIQ